MTTQTTAIIQSKQAENAQTTQYTAGRLQTIIDDFTATNTSASDVTLSIHLVPSGDTAGDANMILKEKIITPSETYEATEIIGHTLEKGDFISTLCDTASALTIRASGREIS